MVLSISRRTLLGTGAAAVALPYIRRARSNVGVLQPLVDMTAETTVPIWPTTDGVSPLYPNQSRFFYKGELYHGAESRVFAIMGLPENIPAGETVPGVVLVHGGGGTAYGKWVKAWTDRGFAAIAMGLEGQTDVDTDAAPNVYTWATHANSGPARRGIYGDTRAGSPYYESLADQWMWHAQAAVIRAHTLLKSNAAVNPNRIGICGLSWGGIITATNIGLDQRSAFAVPIYGCGHLDDMTNQYGTALANNPDYDTIWEPGLRLGLATMPTLWLTGMHDQHFSLVQQAQSYRETGSSVTPRPKHMVSIQPELAHGHGPIFGERSGAAPIPEPMVFAQYYLDHGTPWAEQVNSGRLSDGRCYARFRSAFPLLPKNAPVPANKPQIYYTFDVGHTHDRTWAAAEAQVIAEGSDIYRVVGTVPNGEPKAWFAYAVAESPRPNGLPSDFVKVTGDLVTNGSQVPTTP